MEAIDRIETVLEQREQTPYALCKFLGINQSSYSTWKARNTLPPAKYIADIARFLHVSTDYILTGKESAYTDVQAETYTDDEKELLSIYKALPTEKRYEFKGEMWMDAGLVDMISIEQSLRAGNDKHIVISTKEEGYVRNPAPKWQLWLSNLVYKDKQITDDLRNRHIRYKEQWDKIAELEKQGKALVLRPHKDLGVTRYTTDPEKLGLWFQLGYDETLERMDQIKEFIK